MTSGSSQGLFVIVAIVIFGVFVAISYLLFQDKLNTGLTTIFKDSLEQTNKQLNGETKEEEKEKEDDSMFKFDKPTGTIEGFKQEFVDTETKLEIPSEINGKEVTHISNAAFKNEKFTEIDIPSSVTDIGDEAFYSSPLKSLSLRSNVKVGKDAFYTYFYDVERTGYNTLILSKDGDMVYSLNGKDLNISKPTEMIKNDNMFNKGYSEFLFDNSYNTNGNSIVNSESGFLYRQDYYNGKNSGGANDLMSSSVVIASDSYTAKDVDDILSYVSKEGSLKLSNSSTFKVKVSTQGKVKSVKINGVELKETSNDSFTEFEVPNSIINDGKFNVTRHKDSYGQKLEFPLNTPYDVYVYNKNNDTLVTKDLEKITGRRIGRSNAKNDSVKLTKDFNVDVELSTGVKYSINATSELRFYVVSEFGRK